MAERVESVQHFQRIHTPLKSRTDAKSSLALQQHSDCRLTPTFLPPHISCCNSGHLQTTFRPASRCSLPPPFPPTSCKTAHVQLTGAPLRLRTRTHAQARTRTHTARLQMCTVALSARTLPPLHHHRRRRRRRSLSLVVVVVFAAAAVRTHACDLCARARAQLQRAVDRSSAGCKLDTWAAGTCRTGGQTGGGF